MTDINTDVNAFTIYMSFTGATAAAVKGEVEEYIREELTDSIADGSVLSANVTISKKGSSSSLYVEIKGTTYRQERIALMAWLAESTLWKTCVLDAIAMHSNEYFDLIVETYKNNSTEQLLCSYMKDELLDWAVTESMEYGEPGSQASVCRYGLAHAEAVRKAGKPGNTTQEAEICFVTTL